MSDEGERGSGSGDADECIINRVSFSTKEDSHLKNLCYVKFCFEIHTLTMV